MNRRSFLSGVASTAAFGGILGCGEAGDATEDGGETRSFNDLIEARRSVRRYAPSRIEKDELSAIVSEALNAPSWKNHEETRYHIAQGDEAKSAIWNEALPSFNKANSENAAALVVVTFKKGLSGFDNGRKVNELGDMWGAYDAGLASSYFVLAAKNHGWDTLIMGIRDADALRRILTIPEDEIVMSVIAVGKSAQPYFKRARKNAEEVMNVK